MRVMVGVLGLAMLAAGCGGSSVSEPKVLPSLSASASASPSAAPSPTGINAATPEGAAAFVRFFYAEISRGFAERDPSSVSALSLPTCKTCKLYVDSITAFREKGQTLKGGGFRIQEALAPGGVESTARVDVRYDFGAAQVLAKDGSIIERMPADPDLQEQVELVRVKQIWKVATVKRVRSR